MSRLNVHRIVASEGEKAKLIALGYKEVTREEFLKEVTEDKVPDEEIPADEVPADKVPDEEISADAKPVDEVPAVEGKPANAKPAVKSAAKEVKKSKA